MSEQTSTERIDPVFALLIAFTAATAVACVLSLWLSGLMPLWAAVATTAGCVVLCAAVTWPLARWLL